MPCPNCNCAECAKDRARRRVLLRCDVCGDERESAVYSADSCCLITACIGRRRRAPKEAAQEAAEAATLPAGSTPDPAP